MPKAIPDGFHSVTPYLIIKGAAEAIEFYKKAFGAVEAVRMPGPGGVVVHAEMDFGDSRVMMGEESPQSGVSPATLGGTTAGLMLYVEDVDSTFKQAIDAGCTAKMPPTDMFWGDRFGKLEDPFGHSWSIATHIEDVPPDEMEKRMAEAMKQQS